MLQVMPIQFPEKIVQNLHLRTGAYDPIARGHNLYNTQMQISVFEKKMYSLCRVTLLLV